MDDRRTTLYNLPPELADHPQYEVLRELGRGGMGVVYVAKNKLMDRLEVLKVVNKALLNRPGSVERFLREIRSAAKLNHPNVVAAHSALQIGALLVFAMEYVEGEDLDALVKSRGSLPVTHACHYVQQAAIGLQHAFEKGMVHRDIKPQNLILAREGKRHIVKVLDFGLAKATQEDDLDTGPPGVGHPPGARITRLAALTGAGQMMGTPGFIAPEQILDAASADVRADIYSLGCTLYFLLTGQPPYRGKNLAEILHAHQTAEARPLNLVRPEVPEELAAAVRKMMAKKPAERYQTPAEVVQALAAAGKPATKGTPKSSPKVPARELSDAQKKLLREETILPTAGAAQPTIVPREKAAQPTMLGREAVSTSVWGNLSEDAIPSVEARSAGRTSRPPVVKPTKRKPWLIGAAVATILLLVVGVGAGLVMRKGAAENAGTPIAQNKPESKRANPPPKPLPADVKQQQPPNPVNPPPNPVQPIDLAWDKPIDPNGDSTFKNVGGKLTITVPDKPRVLEPFGNRVNAPRALFDIEGDFTAQVRVGGDFEPAQMSSDGSRVSRIGAGLLLWVDNNTFFRLERAGRFGRAPSTLYAYWAVRQEGKVKYVRQNSLSGAETYLRLERRGNMLLAAFSEDGQQWNAVNPLDIELPAKVKIGLVADSTSARPFAPTFDQFQLKKDQGEMLRVNLPLPAATEPIVVKPPRPPKKSITNSIGMKLVRVEPGVFLMGSPKDEEERRTDEHQHEVEITRPFYVGVYEVTQEQYERITGKNPSWFSSTGLDKNQVRGIDTRHFPVEGVSWEDAVKFCRLLSELPEEKANERLYRLPTEAEWEYICRGGPFFKKPSPPFSFGNSLSSEQANFNGHFPYGGAAKYDPLNRTAKVGSYPPNPLGVYDLHGNVWEWCADWYAAEYSGRKDPQGPDNGERHVLRGGSWVNYGRFCRAAYRCNYAPGGRYSDSGFRVVLVAGARTE